MAWLVACEVRAQDIRLIHARSYLPAVVALLVGRLTGVPFVFDMRALWPEELITAGRLRRGSVLHRAILAMERICLRRAAAVVSLTHAAVGYLKRKYPHELSRQRIAVIPTCADLDRFMPATRRPGQRVIGCLGTVVSGWFRIDWLLEFFRIAARRDPELLFELTTRDDPQQIRAALSRNPELIGRVRIAPCASDRAHEVLRKQVASVMFFKDGLGKLGSCPTRMAESLACGLPVVANEGVGDVARIIHEYRVGVLVDGPSAHRMEAAWDALESLLADPALPARCRRAAQEVFSLEAGTAAYANLYSAILGDRGHEALEL